MILFRLAVEVRHFKHQWTNSLWGNNETRKRALTSAAASRSHRFLNVVSNWAQLSASTERKHRDRSWFT